MSANTFGEIFRVTTFGESHGKAIGLIIDGCPPNIHLDVDFIQQELDRRKPGQSKITTQRKESDTVQIMSGVFEGKTTGAPIGMIIYNDDQRSKDYDHNKEVFRPSHADFTYFKKYGIRDHRGGGRSSARETACRVAAGAVAKLVLMCHTSVKIYAYVSSVGDISIPYFFSTDLEDFIQKREATPVRCPDSEAAQRMIDLINQVRKEGDTVGGIISTVVQGMGKGWGEPVFDKLHARLAYAMMGINAVHGFEYGSGFGAAAMRGSQHNDVFFKNEKGETATKTNHAGGILGGISTGQDIYFRTSFKPVATIVKEQETVDEKGENRTIQGKGRHDPCVVPRAVPIVEAMTALTLVDAFLMQQKNRL